MSGKNRRKSRRPFEESLPLEGGAPRSESKIYMTASGSHTSTIVVRLKPYRMRSKITASYRPVVKIDRFDLIRQPLRAASFPSRGSLKSTEPVAQSQWLPLHAGRLFSETFGPLLLGAGHSLRHRQCRCHLPLRGRQGAGKKTPPGSRGCQGFVFCFGGLCASLFNPSSRRSAGTGSRRWSGRW